MTPARIAELLVPFLVGAGKPRCHSDEPRSGKEESAVLSPTQLQGISMYIDILKRWNARINLTAIRNDEEIVTRHFGESLFAARHLFPIEPHGGTADGCQAEQSSAATASDVSTAVENLRSRQENRGRAALKGHVQVQEHMGALAPVSLQQNSSIQDEIAGSAAQRRKSAPHGDEAGEQRKKITVADVGSGAGFPGIPIKLWAPDISLTLIESNHKKATFLREVVRALTLTSINIQNIRAESLVGQTFDVVTLRAVERFDSILPVASRLVAPGGRLALLIGSAQWQPSQRAVPSLTWLAPVPIPASQSRILAIASQP